MRGHRAAQRDPLAETSNMRAFLEAFARVILEDEDKPADPHVEVSRRHIEDIAAEKGISRISAGIGLFMEAP
jgi:hypothetical protein